MMSRAWAWWVALVAAAGARELDPAACASRFDVQRDKIIRTEESREMGARYLSELDVGARHECLRLCCETDACDVFVYEEKGPGSCYLFNCGPPEDFRCKFTAHSNFSSGVLALSRRLAELQDQEQRTHHERELASLRGGVTTVASSTAQATSVAPPPPASAPAHHAGQAPAPAPGSAHLARTPHALDIPPPPPRRCSRYQFECRRGGECIAVYNACDGVPQCADGSDEAPELGCPSPPPPPPPPGPATPPPTPQLPMKTLQESSEVMAEAGAEAGAEDAGQPPDAPPERWPHRLAQAQPPHRYSGAEGAPSSHIFSHKGGLLQEAEAAAPYVPFEPPWPRRPWPQPGADSMAGERGWSGGGGVGGAAGGGYARLEWPEPDPRRAWPVPQHRPDPDMSVYPPPKTMPEVPMVYSSQQQTLRDSPKKGFELNKKPEVTAPPPPPPAVPPAPLHRDEAPPDAHLSDTNKFPKDKPSDSRKPLGEGSEMGLSETSGEKKAGVPSAHQHYAPDERDGLSERPPAAVLLLVLGVLMTAAMGAMLGCRARAARRRLRRGKSPFAHDADYLVNGMYL